MRLREREYGRERRGSATRACGVRACEVRACEVRGCGCMCGSGCRERVPLGGHPLPWGRTVRR
ncbi:hypothetical protein GCM10010215_51450 [Streptomyces virginiae]|uniref:Uncharacterized protein n=1 Tax=Streptomyces virginiae TaxID=1961 RepID=A0ABQ3NL95_STRVG|nr:hypothetical protein GCM10010215_51450 [Streptomyces virginiae]GHI13554.1 hypothetical protein Scinn_30170 [Streptomyces virginiae]